MNAKDAIRGAMDLSDMVLKMYLDGLSDEDMRIIPVEGMNPIALQVGHLIATEHRTIEMLSPGTSPPLPDGFAEAHAFNADRPKDDPTRYLTKDHYLALWDAQRAATKAALDATSDEDLDRDNPTKFPIAPTIGSLYNLTGFHTALHAGQFVAARRALGKKVAF